MPTPSRACDFAGETERVMSGWVGIHNWQPGGLLVFASLMLNPNPFLPANPEATGGDRRRLGRRFTASCRGTGGSGSASEPYESRGSLGSVMLLSAVLLFFGKSLQEASNPSPICVTCLPARDDAFKGVYIRRHKRHHALRRLSRLPLHQPGESHNLRHHTRPEFIPGSEGLSDMTSYRRRLYIPQSPQRRGP